MRNNHLSDKQKSTSRIVGIVSAISGLLAFMSVLNASNETTVTSWPMEAYQNLVFALGWMTRSSSWWVYLLAIVTMLMVAVLFYKLGSWLYRKFV